MVEHLLETISERVEDITDGRLRAHGVKAFLRMVGVFSPLLIAGYFLYNYGEDRHHYQAWHWPRISLVIGLLVATVILLIVSMKKWEFDPFKPSLHRVAVICILDIALAGFAYWVETKEQQEYKALNREAEKKKREEKLIKNPKLIFERIASTVPALQNDARDNFKGYNVDFEAKCLDITKTSSDGEEQRAAWQGQAIVKLLCEENGAKVAEVHLLTTIKDNPALFDLKPGAPVYVSGEIRRIDVLSKIIWLDDFHIYFLNHKPEEQEDK